MRVYGLRLLVALLTFGLGVAVASLLRFDRSPRFERRAVHSCEHAFVAAPKAEAPQPPRMRMMTLDLETPPRAEVEGGILDEKAFRKPAPDYPPAARDARVQGLVPVRIVVDESGNVASARAVGGHPLLQQAAVEAARGARFAPTMLSGRPVKVSGVITYNFTLQ